MLTAASRASARGDPARLRTACGRDVRVGWLALGGEDRPSWRISLDIGQSGNNNDGTWAGLTIAEACQLAAALLAQVAAVERAAALAARRDKSINRLSM